MQERKVQGRGIHTLIDSLLYNPTHDVLITNLEDISRRIISTARLDMRYKGALLSEEATT